VLDFAALDHAIGIPETAYRWFSASAGTLAAVLIIAGVVILPGRRLLVPLPPTACGRRPDLFLASWSPCGA
jgi:nitrate reductase gamma subunit